MALYELEYDEGIILQSTSAMLGGTTEEEFENYELLELVVTNKRIIYVVEISTGIFSKAKTEVRKVPISSIKVINGIPQVKQVNHDMWGHSVQVQFVHGIEYWTLDKKKIPEWVSEISRLLVGEPERLSQASVPNIEECTYEEEKKKEKAFAATALFTGFKGVVDAAKQTFAEVTQAATETFNGTSDTPKTQATTVGEEPIIEEKKYIYCSNCGEKLVVGSKFCSLCGTPTGPVEQKKEESTVEPITTVTPPSIEESVVQVSPIEPKRQQKYVSAILKCPQCGEVLDSFTQQCPACGLELRETKTSSSVVSFVEKLGATESETAQIQLIRNFPIPNNKEDIVEFMILASTNILGEQSKNVFDAWLVKFEQSYQKAQLVIKKTSDVAYVKTLYEDTCRKIDKVKQLQNVRATENKIRKTGLLIKKIILLIVKNIAIIAGMFLLIMAIQIEQRGENASIYELAGVVLLIISAAILVKRGASLLEILICASSGGILFLLANYFENGSMLQLGGAAVLIISTISFFKKLIKDNKGA